MFMSRSRKLTMKEVQTKLEHLEGAVGEIQEILRLLWAGSHNDAIRHEGMLQDLCNATGVEFVPPPTQDTHIEESGGDSEE
tara:strand:- start:12510 stop:12752 length:243 start_codon:yes stop_codon:yes gene_type:complete